MDEEDNDSENGCPFCNEGWGCKHEFTFADDGCFVDGYEPNSYGFLINAINSKFNQLRKSKTTTPVWKVNWVNEFWGNASEYIGVNEKIDIEELEDSQTITRILLNYICDAPNIAGARIMYDDETPGLTGIGDSYFCEKDPQKTEKYIEDMIKKELEPDT